MLYYEYFLHTTAAPVIQMPPFTAQVISPDTANFSCEASGVFSPNITWRKAGDTTELMSGIDGVMITSQEISSNTTRGTLQLMNTQPSDADDYECVATNAAGEDTASAGLVVNGNTHLYTVGCIMLTHMIPF